MANRFLGEVAAQMSGETYTLRLDMNTLAEIEDATDKHALDLLSEIEKGRARVKDLRALAHAAMLHHHPDASVQDAGVLLSENDGVLLKLLVAAMPTAEEVEGKPGNRKAAQRRKTSTT